MQQTKLTVRVPRELLDDAKRYASANKTTLTRLVSHFLLHLTTHHDPLADAPIVRRLSGTLSDSASIADYHAHLERKHGTQTEGPH